MIPGSYPPMVEYYVDLGEFSKTVGDAGALPPLHNSSTPPPISCSLSYFYLFLVVGGSLYHSPPFPFIHIG